jgi:carbonic anhydrase
MPTTYCNTIPVRAESDIPERFRGTPFESLLRYQNLQADLNEDVYDKPELLILQCMDHRKKLHLPERFAYIVRNAGANIRSNEFSMAYAIGVGRVSYVAMISHTDCGMIDLEMKKDDFIQGLIEHAGWSQGHADMFFHMNANIFSMHDPALFSKMEAQRFQVSYPKILFQPFVYNTEDGLLYIVET